MDRLAQIPVAVSRAPGHQICFRRHATDRVTFQAEDGPHVLASACRRIFTRFVDLTPSQPQDPSRAGHAAGLARLGAASAGPAPSSSGTRFELHPPSNLQWSERSVSNIVRLRGTFNRHPSSTLRLQGKLDGQFSNILRDWPFRASCGCGAGSSGHCEPASAPGRARASISSHLRLRFRIGRPTRAPQRSSAGSNVATSAVRCFRAPSCFESSERTPSP